MSNLKAPWHLWVVGVVGLAWNSFGAYDYVMSMTKGEEYFRQLGLTPEQMAYSLAMPTWVMVAWTVGVWGAVLGSVLLLLRSKWAVEVYYASFIAFVASLVYSYVLVPMPGSDVSILIMQGVIFAACVFFIWYSRWMRKAGYLC